MRQLTIPDKLKEEFATIEALWNTTAETKRVDCLVLSWVKYEKQLRRLFSFFVFQHPNITEEDVGDVVLTFAENNRLYPETFIEGITRLGVASVSEIIGDSYEELWSEIDRIKSYRNKIMHGQLTGKDLQCSQLENDVIMIVRWMAALADAADAAYGYDGVRRNTFVFSKKTQINIQNYPFSDVNGLREWLRTLPRR